MPNLFDELQMGTVSRRRILELLSVAGGSAALAAAQKQYRTLVSHAVYDGRGHIVAVRLEE